MTTCRRKKHPCPDCRQCQQCSPARCHLCRGQGAEDAQSRFSGLCLAEQIALYEAINRGESAEDGQAVPCLAGYGDAPISDKTD